MYEQYVHFIRSPYVHSVWMTWRLAIDRVVFIRGRERKDLHDPRSPAPGPTARGKPDAGFRHHPLRSEYWRRATTHSRRRPLPWCPDAGADSGERVERPIAAGHARRVGRPHALYRARDPPGRAG